MTSSDDRSPSDAAPTQEGRRTRPRLRAEEWALLVLAPLIVIVPSLLERCPSPSPRSETSSVEPLRIDVERSAWYEWSLLEGVGETRARRIVDFIRSRSPLTSIDELRDVPGMPSGWLDNARPYLYLSSSRTGNVEPPALLDPSVPTQGR